MHPAATERRPLPLVWLLIAGAWLALFEASRLLEYSAHASLWFAPTGATYAALVVWGHRALPALFIAAGLGTTMTVLRLEPAGISTTTLLSAAIGYACTHVLPLWGLGVAANWSARRDPAGGFGTLPTTVVVVGGVIACLGSAIGGSLVMATSGLLAIGELRSVVVPWTIGDYAGLLTLGPLLAWTARRWRDRRLWQALAAPSWRWTGKVLLMLALAVGVMVLAWYDPGHEPTVFAVFFALAVQQWISYGHRPVLALLSLALMAILLAVLTATLALGQHALKLQFAIIALAISTVSTLSLTALRSDNSRLRDLLRNDPLSGALSRAFFLEQAQRELIWAQENDSALSIVMLDMDHLKPINDQRGHAAGDDAIRRTADITKARLKDGEALGRLGGDEFALCLPATDAPFAAERAALVLADLQAQSDDGLPLAASFGVAEQRPGDTLAQLLARADRALLRAKQRGRSRVEIGTD